MWDSGGGGVQSSRTGQGGRKWVQESADKTRQAAGVEGQKWGRGMNSRGEGG